MNPRLWREDAEGAFPHMDAHLYQKGGGGGGQAAMMMMMQQQQQQENARAAMQEEFRRQEAAQAKQVEEQKAAQAIIDKKAKAASNLGKTLNNASAYGTSQLAQYGGVDNYGLLGAYNAALNNARQMVPEDEENPQNFINPSDLWSQASTQQRGMYQNKYKQRYNQMYAPGYQQRFVPDEMDDPILQSILGTMETDARAEVDRARARGQLNDTAYETANKLLGTQSTQARTQLTGLGDTVLQRYRDKLGLGASALEQQVQDWNFGDPLNFTQAQSDLNKLRGGFGTNLENDIRSTVGDRDLFNIDLLLGKARNKAGSANAAGTTSPLLSAFATTPTTATDKRDDLTKGNVGVF